MLSPSLQQERARLLEQMAHIDRMVRGHVSQQTYQVQRGERTVTQVLTTSCSAVKTAGTTANGWEPMDFIVQAVEGHDRFQALAQR